MTTPPISLRASSCSSFWAANFSSTTHHPAGRKGGQQSVDQIVQLIQLLSSSAPSFCSAPWADPREIRQPEPGRPWDHVSGRYCGTGRLLSMSSTIPILRFRVSVISLLAAFAACPGRSAVQFLTITPGQPERHRPDADHLRRRRGQLRRHPELHGRRRPDLRGCHQRRVPGHHPGLSDLGLPGRLLFSHGFMVYLAIVLAVVLQLFTNRTWPEPRSVGESCHGRCGGHQRPATALPPAGAGISGLGGLYYTMDYIRAPGPTTAPSSPGLAGRGAGDLRHLADSQRHLGLLPVRPAVLGVPHPRPGPAGRTSSTCCRIS